jgi:glycerol-3-phosphate dehydrogenase
VDQAATLGRLPEVACVTRNLNVHGFAPRARKHGSLGVYGSDALAIRELIRQEPKLGKRLDPALPYTAAEVVWVAREEMARTVDDVLARRTRALFLNAEAARQMAPEVARLMATELGHGEMWQLAQVGLFEEISSRYLLAPSLGYAG